MAIIGFIVLVLIGLFLVGLTVMVFVGSAFFGGANGAEAILPATIAALIFWAAFHWAPFTITLVGG